MAHFDPRLFGMLDQLIVRHSRFEAARAAIDEAVRNADLYTDKSLLPVIGPSRSGKSRLLEDCLAALYPPDHPADAVRPVRRVVMPRSSRPKAMLMKLQHALGNPFYAVGTEDQMLIRLVPLLRRLEVKVLLVDELQHCVSHRGEINYDVADVFKVLLDEAQVTIVAAGLENAVQVLDANEQLTGRCDQAVHLPRFDWTDPDSRAEFIALVQAFCRGLPALQMPPFDDEAECFRWYVACGGLIGYLHKIFRKLLTLLQDEDRLKVGAGDLDYAHAQGLYYRGAQIRPFARGFDASDVITGLSHAARIGERREPGDAPSLKRPLNARLRAAGRRS